MSETRIAQSLDFPTSAQLRFLPEGPIGLSEGKFSWVGIQHGGNAKTGSLNIYDFSQIGEARNQSFDLPGRPGFAFPCETPGKFVIGLERSVGLFDVSDQSWSPFCDAVDSDVDNTIINDGIVYGANLIFGTKDLEFATKKAGLYLYRGSDQKLIRLRDDQICSNGKVIVQQDGQTFLLDIDSPTRTVVRYALDVDAGTLGPPTTVLDLTNDPAVPDGMILTPDGKGLIVAMFHPGDAADGQTRWYDLGGELKCTWQTPKSRQNTCPALIRHDGALKLLITTAVENMTDQDLEKCPSAGHLFLGDTDFADDGQPLSQLFPV